MNVLLFGIAKDIVGASSLSIAEHAPHTVADLKDHICKAYPRFSSLKSLAIAVNSNYAQDTDAIKDTDEIAIIPPVSGG